MRRANGSAGFTLIELLVVIAIIAILVAIIFPTFMRAKEGVRGAQCISQMHDIYVALSQYHDDNKAYPPVLFGFVELPAAPSASSNTLYAGSGSPVSMYSVQYRPLFTSGQKYMQDITKFFCPDNPNNSPTQGFTLATCPTMLPACPNDGSKSCDNGPCVWLTQADVHAMGTSSEGAVALTTTPYFYKADSYDTGPAITANGTPVTSLTSANYVPELHYSLDCTGKEDTNDQASYPNQLKYTDPPTDSTVVTWCTYHSAVASATTVNVLMLSGTCKTASTQSWVQMGPLQFKF
jgi:prepilin-type N-terminal cleavage/methylation domain-containing protein